MNVAKTIPFKAEGPQPLLREIPQGEPYPVESLGPLRAVVEAAHDISKAPIAIAAQSALSAASLAVQAHADVETLGGKSPVSLYFLTVAESGERKSATDKVVMSGLRRFERERASEYREELQLWRNTQAIWKVDHEKIMGEFKKKPGNRVSAQADLDDLGAEPPAPLSPKLTSGSPTIEGLHKQFISGQPSLGVFSDEGGEFLGGYSMNSDNMMKTVSGLSKLWDGDGVDRVRAGDGAVFLPSVRLAAHLMGTPVAVAGLLADPIANGQGFLARFLITNPPSAIGYRMDIDHDEASDLTVAAMSRYFQTILRTPMPTVEGSPQELEPRQISLSAGARKVLRAYYRHVEVAQREGGEFESVRPFASKSPEQAARLAGVLTLWDNLDALEIAAETMADGVAIAQFYLGEASRLAGAAVVDQKTAKAEKLRIWLLEKWPTTAKTQGREPETILPGDVVQNGPGALRDTKDAKEHLKMLEEHGWVTQLPANAEVDGMARKLAYRIVRASP